MSQFINLSDYISLLNEQLILLESLVGHQNKTNALLETALEGDFPQKSGTIIHNFLWALSDIIKQAKRSGEYLLDNSSRLNNTFKKIFQTIKEVSDAEIFH